MTDADAGHDAEAGHDADAGHDTETATARAGTATRAVPSPPAPSIGARRPATPSVRPALVVVGVALLLILLFGVASALTTNPAPSVPTARHVGSTGLVAEPAAGPLHPIEILGTPPADILDALALPKGSREKSATPWSGSTQFSGTMSFEVGATQAQVISFFHTELRARGWSILDVGPARGHPGATEVLAQRASTDGWFWEAGAVVSPTAFPKRSAHAEATRYSLELYEMPDAT
jgi:hypothetical protein